MLFDFPGREEGATIRNIGIIKVFANLGTSSVNQHLYYCTIMLKFMDGEGNAVSLACMYLVRQTVDGELVLGVNNFCLQEVSLLLVMAMNVEVTRRRRSTSSEDEMYGGDQQRNEFLQAKNNGRAKDMSPSHGLNDQRMNNEKHRVPEEQK
ncbi:unnamed protein product [Nippostrongylus brasiliensis]|uniref:Gag-pol polyprotein n=1 Tax=Nippostrongylus brasiliensis TaxID=27835 RepID=A0A0N4XK75_NIPBR|nr:unnamed protein product [Nippostrongylus brasiliensis]